MNKVQTIPLLFGVVVFTSDCVSALNLISNSKPAPKQQKREGQRTPLLQPEQHQQSLSQRRSSRSSIGHNHEAWVKFLPFDQPYSSAIPIQWRNDEPEDIEVQDQFQAPQFQQQQMQQQYQNQQQQFQNQQYFQAQGAFNNGSQFQGWGSQWVFNRRQAEQMLQSEAVQHERALQKQVFYLQDHTEQEEEQEAVFMQNPLWRHRDNVFRQNQYLRQRYMDNQSQQQNNKSQWPQTYKQGATSSQQWQNSSGQQQSDGDAPDMYDNSPGNMTRAINVSDTVQGYIFTVEEVLEMIGAFEPNQDGHNRSLNIEVQHWSSFNPNFPRGMDVQETMTQTYLLSLHEMMQVEQRQVQKYLELCSTSNFANNQFTWNPLNGWRWCCNLLGYILTCGVYRWLYYIRAKKWESLSRNCFLQTTGMDLNLFHWVRKGIVNVEVANSFAYYCLFSISTQKQCRWYIQKVRWYSIFRYVIMWCSSIISVFLVGSVTQNVWDEDNAGTGSSSKSGWFGKYTSFWFAVFNFLFSIILVGASLVEKMWQPTGRWQNLHNYLQTFRLESQRLQKELQDWEAYYSFGLREIEMELVLKMRRVCNSLTDEQMETLNEYINSPLPMPHDDNGRASVAWYDWLQYHKQLVKKQLSSAGYKTQWGLDIHKLADALGLKRQQVEKAAKVWGLDNPVQLQQQEWAQTQWVSQACQAQNDQSCSVNIGNKQPQFWSGVTQKFFSKAVKASPLDNKFVSAGALQSPNANVNDIDWQMLQLQQHPHIQWVVQKIELQEQQLDRLKEVNQRLSDQIKIQHQQNQAQGRSQWSSIGQSQQLQTTSQQNQSGNSNLEPIQIQPSQWQWGESEGKQSSLDEQPQPQNQTQQQFQSWKQQQTQNQNQTQQQQTQQAQSPCYQQSHDIWNQRQWKMMQQLQGQGQTTLVDPPNFGGSFGFMAADNMIESDIDRSRSRLDFDINSHNPRTIPVGNGMGDDSVSGSDCRAGVQYSGPPGAGWQSVLFNRIDLTDEDLREIAEDIRELDMDISERNMEIYSRQQLSKITNDALTRCCQLCADFKKEQFALSMLGLEQADSLNWAMQSQNNKNNPTQPTIGGWAWGQTNQSGSWTLRAAVQKYYGNTGNHNGQQLNQMHSRGSAPVPPPKRSWIRHRTTTKTHVPRPPQSQQNTGTNSSSTNSGINNAFSSSVPAGVAKLFMNLHQNQQNQQVDGGWGSGVNDEQLAQEHQAQAEAQQGSQRQFTIQADIPVDVNVEAVQPQQTQSRSEEGQVPEEEIQDPAQGSDSSGGSRRV